MTTQEKREAFLENTSSILLKNKTICELKALTSEMSYKDNQKIVTFEDLISDMIRVYRKKKGLDWDPYSND